MAVAVEGPMRSRLVRDRSVAAWVYLAALSAFVGLIAFGIGKTSLASTLMTLLYLGVGVGWAILLYFIVRILILKSIPSSVNLRH